jgi:hypothetical protein
MITIILSPTVGNISLCVMSEFALDYQFRFRNGELSAERDFINTYRTPPY